MNIGIVTTWFERGAAYVSKQFRDELIKENNVYIYARGGEEYAINDPNWNNEWVTWGKKVLFGVPTQIDLKDFEKWIHKNKLDIIFFNEQHWWEIILFCNKMKIKIGAYIDFYTERTIPFFQCYDFLICNTKKHYETFKWHPNVYYIPWGTDIDLFKPSSFLPVDKEIITFFHSCGYSPERKGTDLLIKAFSSIDNKKSKLIIHSQFSIEDAYPELKEEIAILKEEHRLCIYEKTVSSPGLYDLGDIYVYPTRLEGIGLTIAEALSCGLPVITSDNAPMNEFIDNTNGRCIKVNKLYSREDGYYWPLCEVDINDLLENMNWYINRYDQISELKRQARVYAERNLNWSVNSKKINVIFREVHTKRFTNKSLITNSVRNFEENRESFSYKIHKKSPLLLKILKYIYKFIK